MLCCYCFGFVRVKTQIITQESVKVPCMNLEKHFTLAGNFSVEAFVGGRDRILAVAYVV